MSSITESVESIQSLESEAVVSLEVVLASLKKFGVADLFKVSKVSLAEAERLVKSGKTEPKVEKEKKAMPKQLRKPTEWVAYVLRYSLANGWESFSTVNKKTHEEITYPASGQNQHGEHVFPGGKKMILTQAMSLSKKYWTPKEKGTREDLYHEFEAWYAAQLAAQPVEEVRAESPKAPMVRKTAAEKEAEKEAKAKQKEEEKLAKAALKEKVKQDKAAAAAAAPAKAKKAAAPAAAPAAAAAVPAAAMAGGLKPGPKKAAQKAAPVEEWKCPTDGNVYPFPYKGKDYFRDFENQVWEKAADGGLGKWAGVFIFSEDRIDETVADPFADEEETAE
jgi:hypothetical protein